MAVSTTVLLYVDELSYNEVAVTLNAVLARTLTGQITDCLQSNLCFLVRHRPVRLCRSECPALWRGGESV
jgi:hypothetical protein